MHIATSSALLTEAEPASSACPEMPGDLREKIIKSCPSGLEQAILASLNRSWKDSARGCSALAMVLRRPQLAQHRLYQLSCARQGHHLASLERFLLRYPHLTAATLGDLRLQQPNTRHWLEVGHLLSAAAMRLPQLHRLVLICPPPAATTAETVTTPWPQRLGPQRWPSLPNLRHLELLAEGQLGLPCDVFNPLVGLTHLVVRGVQMGTRRQNIERSSDLGFQHPAAGLRLGNLKVLQIENVSDVSDLRHFTGEEGSLPALRTLRVIGCHQLSHSILPSAHRIAVHGALEVSFVECRGLAGLMLTNDIAGRVGKLSFRGCSRLAALPVDIELAVNLTELDTRGTAIDLDDLPLEVEQVLERLDVLDGEDQRG